MRAWVGIYLKGFCMGAADIVPGVSGGTIALITGIYERLITAIAAIDPSLLGHLLALHRPEGRARFRDALVEIDLPFLLVLGAGIATAVLLVSRVVLHAFEGHPAALNAFFFGLIGASALVISGDVTVRTPRRLAVAAIGFLLAFAVSGTAEPADGGSLLVVFLAGAIAISAMVLPGISGAAFLYILGQYQYLLGALSEFVDTLVALLRGGSLDATIDPGIVVVTFLVGAVVGLLSMARIVAWSLARYREATMLFLVSLMAGSLRLPIEAILAESVDPSPLVLGGLLAAAAVGAGAVLALDRYTDSLAYV